MITSFVASSLFQYPFMTFGPWTMISPSSDRSGSSHASVSIVTLTPLATKPTQRSLDFPGPDQPFAATSGEVSVSPYPS